MNLARLREADPLQPERLRMPDFLIIGAMKSGTTSLYRWLDAQPEFRLPEIKEPNFFSDESVWSRGVGWYSELFTAAGPEHLTGEASVSYMDPAHAPVAAERVRAVLADVDLIIVVREPVERLRSHYRHQVQRGRERRPLVQAVREPGNPYVRRSLYHAGVRHYLERFARERFCVVRFEDLTEQPAPAWTAVLAHLGVAPRPAPRTAVNVTRDKRRFTPALLRLWEAGLLPARRLPGPVRRLGKVLLTRDDGKYRRLLQGSSDHLPSDVLDAVRADARDFERALGFRQPLWSEAA